MMPKMHRFKSILPVSVPRTLLLIVIGVQLVAAMPAAAQTANDLSPLLNRLRLIENDLRDLQLQVFRGKGAPARTATADQQTAQGSSGAAMAEVRFAELEEQIRSLTGTFERMAHDVTKTRSRLDKLIEDIDFRLTALEGKLEAAEAARIAAANATEQPAATETAADANAADASAEAAEGTETASAGQTVVSDAAPGTQVLGTIPADEVQNGQQTAAVAPAEPPKPKTILPEGTVRERYNFAFGLLRRLKTDKAETAFKEFLEAHEADPLAHNARYWLGETYYARRDYRQAATAFVTGYSKSPTGPKARDNLLKLGMSLVRLEQNEDACASFEELLAKFTTPPDSKARKIATAEMGRAGC